MSWSLLCARRWATHCLAESGSQIIIRLASKFHYQDTHLNHIMQRDIALCIWIIEKFCNLSYYARYFTISCSKKLTKISLCNVCTAIPLFNNTGCKMWYNYFYVDTRDKICTVVSEVIKSAYRLLYFVKIAFRFGVLDTWWRKLIHAVAGNHCKQWASLSVFNWNTWLTVRQVKQLYYEALRLKETSGVCTCV